MTTTFPTPLNIEVPIVGLWRRSFAASPLMMRSAFAMIGFFAMMLVLQEIDGRLLNGVNVWDKPGKFFLSLGVLLATVSWALSHLVPPRSRTVRWSIIVLVASSWSELVYICIRAFRGEASHFNVGTPLDAALYSLMGIGSLGIAVSTLIIGVAIYRKHGGSLTAEAAGLGLALGAGLATLVAGYMSSGTGHWVGGDQTDATGLPFFHWSTTGGDLRISHFVALHAMQLVPLAALSGKRVMIYAMAAVVTMATAALFVQAMMGVPLFKV